MGADTAHLDLAYFACVSPHLDRWTSRADCHACNTSQTTIKTHTSPVARFGPDTDEGQLPTTTTILNNKSSEAHTWLTADPIFDGENAPEGFTTRQSQHHAQHATHNKQVADIVSTSASTTTALEGDLSLGLASPTLGCFAACFAKATRATDAVGNLPRRTNDEGFPNADLVGDDAHAVQQHAANDNVIQNSAQFCIAAAVAASNDEDDLRKYGVCSPIQACT